MLALNAMRFTVFFLRRKHINYVLPIIIVVIIIIIMIIIIIIIIKYIVAAYIVRKLSILH